MKQLFISLLFTIAFNITRAQGDAKQLIGEGVALHDKGDFKGAIAKYDAALQVDPANSLAMYEKSYSLMALKKYDDAEELLGKILKESKDPDIRKLCYVNYGSLLDFEGKEKKSLKLYEDGIKEFPDDYLLYYNKGVTEAGMNETDDAIKSFEQALSRNPRHASSHNALGRIMAPKNRIPAILSMFSFLLIEPEGDRASQNIALLDKLIMRGIEKKDDKNVIINIDASLLDKKNKREEDDFSSAELMLSLLAANNDVPDSIGAKTDADRLSYKLQMLTDIIDETNKKEKGFYKNFYVPLFSAMKEKDFFTTACYVALTSSGKKDNDQWLNENKSRVDKFFEWFEKYQWTKE